MVKILAQKSKFQNPSLLKKEIEDLFFEKSLSHYASHIFRDEFHCQTELEVKVQIAITMCLNAGLPAHRHFKSIFICADCIKKDWLLSDMAFHLVVLMQR
jgi:hypothetical protein